MSIIKPFAALRPRKDIAHKAASPPYDVLNSEEAQEMAKDNPVSFLHINDYKNQSRENLLIITPGFVYSIVFF